MPDSGANVRFQVLVNGEARALAGLESVGVLSVTLTWVRRNPAAAPQEVRESPDFREEEWVGNETRLSLGGLDSGTREHMDWFGGDLQAGDEVTVRVLPPGEFDPPLRREFEPGGG